MKKTHRLTYAAPASDSVVTGRIFVDGAPRNLWGQVPWTVPAIREAKAAGAWFAKSRHNFASREAAIEAGVGE